MIQNSVIRFNRIFDSVHDKIDFKDLTAIQQLLSKYVKPSKRQESEDSRRIKRTIHNPTKQHPTKNRFQLKKQATSNYSKVDLEKTLPEYNIDEGTENTPASAGLANGDIYSEIQSPAVQKPNNFFANVTNKIG